VASPETFRYTLIYFSLIIFLLLSSCISLFLYLYFCNFPVLLCFFVYHMAGNVPLKYKGTMSDTSLHIDLFQFLQCWSVRYDMTFKT
jgi:hypothetical protein